MLRYYQSCCMRLVQLCLAELCQTARGGWERSVWLRLLISFWKPPPFPTAPHRSVNFGATARLSCQGFILFFSSRGLISWKDVHEIEIKT